jgi:hypothetical protein
MTDDAFIRNGLRALWFLAGLGLVVGIALQNLPLSGILRASVAPGEASPFIGILRPEERMTIANDGGSKVYQVTGDPTYLQVTAPRFFRHATMTLEFRNPRRIDVSIGPAITLEKWGFALQSLDSKAHPAEDIGDGWRRAAVSFDLPAAAVKDGEVQVALSVPAAGKSPGVVEVRAIEVTYDRPPLTLQRLIEAVRKLFSV